MVDASQLIPLGGEDQHLRLAKFNELLDGMEDAIETREG
jgi:hypothetical protein